MSRRALFLDRDGVLLDPELTPLEWVGLTGEVSAPATGGRPRGWGSANAETVPRLFAEGDRRPLRLSRDGPRDRRTGEGAGASPGPARPLLADRGSP